MKELFQSWKSKSDLGKLQYAYALFVVLSLVAAGLVGLLNQTVALQILQVTWVAFVAFVVNLVVFSLINLSKDSDTKTAKKK